jgi:hypothetical protein
MEGSNRQRTRASYFGALSDCTPHIKAIRRQWALIASKLHAGSLEQLNQPAAAHLDTLITITSRSRPSTVRRSLVDVFRAPRQGHETWFLPARLRGTLMVLLNNCLGKSLRANINVPRYGSLSRFLNNRCSGSSMQVENLRRSQETQWLGCCWIRAMETADPFLLIAALGVIPWLLPDIIAH